MMLSEKVQLITEILDELFPDPQIPLNHTDPYTLLIAVLLSAQCTDKMVNRVTPYLFQKASSPEMMVKLSIEEIQSMIRPCGLSGVKAKAIRALSQILIERYGGGVPDTLEALEDLPGVGHKTASVVLIQAFHKAAFPVDTHILRLAKRWGLSEGKSVAQVERDLKRLFPENTWAKLHLQIIYYARTYCPALRHEVENCPICKAIQKIS